MKAANSLKEVQKLINTGQPVLIYFSGENCSICKSLKPKIEEAISDNFPKMNIIEVKTDIHKEITSHFTVFSIPTTLIFFDQKEFKRVGRNLSIFQFTQDISRVYNLFCE